MPDKRKIIVSLLIVLAVITAALIYIEECENRHGILKVAVLNIGQGDSIYIEAPNGRQVIVDGGPDKSILRELGGVIPFYDRSIDMLIVTNPDKDHFAGFIDVMKNFKVGEIFEPGTNSDTEAYKTLEEEITAKKIPKIMARRGMRIILDQKRNVFLDILFPDRDVSSWKTNDGSIVAKLSYGKTSVMLTGDMPQGIEKYLISLDSSDLKSDILKVGHHGSKTSTSPEFVAAVSPKYAAISDGVNNRYGHPNKETLDTLNSAKIKILRTDLVGRIRFESDGRKFLLLNDAGFL